MNKGYLKIWSFLIIGGIALGVVAPWEGFSMPPNESTSPCNQPQYRIEKRVNLLQYYAWLRSTSDEEQEKQYRCAASTVTNGKPRGKLLLALTLTIPDAPFADFARAKLVLGDYLQNADNEEPEDRTLAALMLTLLDEVARLEEQLEQLKAIEKDITETEQSVNVPTPAPEPTPVPNDEPDEEDTSGR